MTDQHRTELTADDRIAPAGAAEATGPVTLINSFRVAPDRDAAFREIWGVTSTYFTARPGFVSLRLHRAVSDDAAYRWVNVAVWESEAAFRAAHGTEEFRSLVTAPAWAEFPSTPALFEVETAIG